MADRAQSTRSPSASLRFRVPKISFNSAIAVLSTTSGVFCVSSS